jgi:hypothetical protein
LKRAKPFRAKAPAWLPATPHRIIWLMTNRSTWMESLNNFHLRRPPSELRMEGERKTLNSKLLGFGPAQAPMIRFHSG